MVKNAYLLAKIGADTAENERNFAENGQLPTDGLRLRGPRDRRPGLGTPSTGARRPMRQNFARFRLYRRRSLQVNTRLAAFFKIYQGI